MRQSGRFSGDDLLKLKAWRESEPAAPDGPWYKDFGSFKLCGEGRFPKTFLLGGQAVKDMKICRDVLPSPRGAVMETRGEERVLDGRDSTGT